MKQALRNLVTWIIVSSNDPEEVSLTIKGALVGMIPTLMAVAGLAHLNLGDGSALTAVFDALAQTVQVILTLVATAMAAWGAMRKVFYLIFPGYVPPTLP